MPIDPFEILHIWPLKASMQYKKGKRKSLSELTKKTKKYKKVVGCDLTFNSTLLKMPPLSRRQAAGVRTPANLKSTVLLSCWWQGGFQGALFHNATLSNIKNTKGNKTEQGWSTRWIQQWGWFLKMSLKTIITDAVTLSFATKKTTAEAQYTVIRCKQEKSASLGKSIVDQYEQLKRNRRSDKVPGRFR